MKYLQLIFLFFSLLTFSQSSFEKGEKLYVQKKIKEENLKGVAAIAGKQVAEKFGLKILESKIQNNSQNQTRFVLVGKNNKNYSKEVNKDLDKKVLKVFCFEVTNGTVEKMLVLCPFPTTIGSFILLLRGAFVVQNIKLLLLGILLIFSFGNLIFKNFFKSQFLSILINDFVFCFFFI